MTPKHCLLRYMTPMGVAVCSVIFGRIGETPAVLLVERDDNICTSITNATHTVVRAATLRAKALFNPFDGEMYDPDIDLISDYHSISWFEAYEFRISTDGRFPDPAVMRIDVDAETWSPVDAPTLESLRPFFVAFRTEPPLPVAEL